MKKIQKIVLVLLVFVLSVALFACGEETSSQEEPSVTAPLSAPRLQADENGRVSWADIEGADRYLTSVDGTVAETADCFVQLISGQSVRVKAVGQETESDWSEEIQYIRREKTWEKIGYVVNRLKPYLSALKESSEQESIGGAFSASAYYAENGEKKSVDVSGKGYFSRTDSAFLVELDSSDGNRLGVGFQKGTVYLKSGENGTAYDISALSPLVETATDTLLTALKKFGENADAWGDNMISSVVTYGEIMDLETLMPYTEDEEKITFSVSCGSASKVMQFLDAVSKDGSAVARLKEGFDVALFVMEKAGCPVVTEDGSPLTWEDVKVLLSSSERKDSVLFSVSFPKKAENASIAFTIYPSATDDGTERVFGCSLEIETLSADSRPELSASGYRYTDGVANGTVDWGNGSVMTVQSVLRLSDGFAQKGNLVVGTEITVCNQSGEETGKAILYVDDTSCTVHTEITEGGEKKTDDYSFDLFQRSVIDIINENFSQPYKTDWKQLISTVSAWANGASYGDLLYGILYASYPTMFEGMQSTGESALVDLVGRYIQPYCTFAVTGEGSFDTVVDSMRDLWRSNGLEESVDGSFALRKDGFDASVSGEALFDILGVYFHVPVIVLGEPVFSIGLGGINGTVLSPWVQWLLPTDIYRTLGLLLGMSPSDYLSEMSDDMLSLSVTVGTQERTEYSRFSAQKRNIMGVPNVTVNSGGVAYWYGIPFAQGYSYSINGGTPVYTKNKYVNLTDGDVVTVRAEGFLLKSEWSAERQYIVPTQVDDEIKDIVRGLNTYTELLASVGTEDTVGAQVCLSAYYKHGTEEENVDLSLSANVQKNDISAKIGISTQNKERVVLGYQDEKLYVNGGDERILSDTAALLPAVRSVANYLLIVFGDVDIDIEDWVDEIDGYLKIASKLLDLNGLIPMTFEEDSVTFSMTCSTISTIFSVMEKAGENIDVAQKYWDGCIEALDKLGVSVETADGTLLTYEYFMKQVKKRANREKTLLSVRLTMPQKTLTDIAITIDLSALSADSVGYALGLELSVPHFKKEAVEISFDGDYKKKDISAFVRYESEEKTIDLNTVLKLSEALMTENGMLAEAWLKVEQDGEISEGYGYADGTTVAADVTDVVSNVLGKSYGEYSYRYMNVPLAQYICEQASTLVDDGTHNASVTETAETVFRAIALFVDDEQSFLEEYASVWQPYCKFNVEDCTSFAEIVQNIETLAAEKGADELWASVFCENGICLRLEGENNDFFDFVDIFFRFPTPTKEDGRFNTAEDVDEVLKAKMPEEYYDFIGKDITAWMGENVYCIAEVGEGATVTLTFRSAPTDGTVFFVLECGAEWTEAEQ